ncbi:hypothetical protein OV203_20210 [Nannocystis sp. ILAH1]|uniref:hypothetical protein n=1 Tax=Nannocystis sp. ILAH1 TaxID=2996789 RepID=UPI00226ECCB6|nr:hypothetical protein [Nannocystis sp. ILAH1]MCY0989475.1 hypothetical protein [Nannocystis sp. ILAH1]
MTLETHVVALGAWTPVGRTAASAAAAVRAGISRIQEHPEWVDAAAEPLCGAFDATLPGEVQGATRVLELTRRGLLSLASDVSRALPTAAPSLLLALPEHRPGWTGADDAAVLEGLHQLQLPQLGRPRVTAVLRGHGGGLHAIEQAAQLISDGHEQLCIVGGTDSYWQPQTLAWLNREQRLRSTGTRSGFLPGEASSFVILASAPARRQLGLPSFSLVRAAHSHVEAVRLGSDDECLGVGLAELFSRVASSGLPAGHLIDDIYCDLNGERYRTDEWGFALLRAAGFFRDPTKSIHFPADAWGDVGAASGPLFIALASRAWARNYARGPRALAFAGSDSGARAAVLLERGSEH